MLDPYVFVGDRDRFELVPALHAAMECPAEQEHFEAREGQHGPEAADRHEQGDAESAETHGAEEHESAALAE